MKRTIGFESSSACFMETEFLVAVFGPRLDEIVEQFPMIINLFLIEKIKVGS